ncbi:GGDEF domain-containing protein [Thalassotalea crassostreae]|uniref:GGDEF domain-containing protein n=1 Tax=Thalassotalea crassostreae TaxID=1763536 RepID=UPI000838E8FA|nr:GGDEF domain-containing protein [Thalassotalea crassostreae]
MNNIKSLIIKFKLCSLTLAFGVMFYTVSLTAHAQSSSLSSSELIEYAHKIKSSNLHESQQIISILKSRLTRLSTSQREQLNYLIGYNSALNGDFIKAIYHHNKNTTSRNINYNIVALNNILYLETKLENYRKSSNYIEPIMSLLNNELLEQKVKYDTLSTLAWYYNQLGDYPQALQNLNELDTIDRNSLSSRDLCFTISQKLNTLFALNEISIKSSFVEEAKNYCLKSGEQIIHSQIIIDVATELIELEKFSQANKLLLDHQQQLETTNFSLNNLKFYSALATTFYHLGDLSTATVYVDKAILNKEQHPNNAALLNAYRIAHNIANKFDNTEAKISTLRQQILLEHKITNIWREKSVALNKIKFKLNTLENELREYQQSIVQENKHSKFQQNISQKLENFVVGGRIYQGLLTLCILFLLKMLYNNWRLKRSIEEQLCFDDATKVMQRNHFLECCQKEIARGQIIATNYALVILNIDNLRNVNELQGNDRCDRLIRLIIDLSNEHLPIDVIKGRLGGDEFGFLIPNKDIKRTMNLVENYRYAINVLDTKNISYQFDVSASFGVSDTTTSGYDIKQLFNDSEQALVTAKQQNKNCVIRYQTKLQLV